MSEFRQLLIGISTNRYLPARGTAGLQRSAVNGCNRVPRPPPMMMASTRFWVVRAMVGFGVLKTCSTFACEGNFASPNHHLHMCGIVGYVGQQNAVPVILEGLKR